MRDRTTLTQLLAALAQRDEGGDGNLEQVAWELDVEPGRIGEAWQEALRAGLIQAVAANEPAEGRVRLTAGGWVALSEASNAT